MGSVWRGSALEKAWVREDFDVLTLNNELEQWRSGIVFRLLSLLHWISDLSIDWLWKVFLTQKIAAKLSEIWVGIRLGIQWSKKHQIPVVQHWFVPILV